MTVRRAGSHGSLFVVGLLVLAACGSANDTRTSSSATPPTGVAPPASAGDASVVVTTTPLPGETLPAVPAPTIDPSIDPQARLTTVAHIPKAIALAVPSGRIIGHQQLGDPQRMYVATQDGTVIAIKGNDRQVVLDITDQTAAAGERGLLGLAIDPMSRMAYVNFTDSRGDTVVAEFAVADDGNFDPDSQRTVLTIKQPYANHNGGDLAFGPDGMLYIATGDGGSGGDPERRALRLDNLLGKILRISPAQSGTAAYTVPADNPFVGQAGALPEIWSYGLRNPWRFSFDRQTGDLWIADVGQGQLEEVDWARGPQAGRGVNYGWSAFEGSKRFNDDQPVAGAVPPFYEYTHAEGGCAISGGVRYRGQALPVLRGWYVFSDFCRSTIRAMQIDGDAPGRIVELAESSQVGGIAEGPMGELYVLSLDQGVQQLTP